MKYLAVLAVAAFLEGCETLPAECKGPVPPMHCPERRQTQCPDCIEVCEVRGASRCDAKARANGNCRCELVPRSSRGIEGVLGPMIY